MLPLKRDADWPDLVVFQYHARSTRIPSSAYSVSLAQRVVINSGLRGKGLYVRKNYKKKKKIKKRLAIV
jgi:hypothetical protein